METLEAINTRKSIRKFKDKKIDNEIIEKLLKAAMSAPSACNYQPWEIILIDDREKLDQIPSFSPYAKMCLTAPLAICILADTRKQETIEYCMQDCAAVTQNLLLAAHDLGLGGVWTGIYPRDVKVEGYKKMLKYPDYIVPISLVVLGYADEDPEAKNKYKKEKIHKNTW